MFHWDFIVRLQPLPWLRVHFLLFQNKRSFRDWECVYTFIKQEQQREYIVLQRKLFRSVENTY